MNLLEFVVGGPAVDVVWFGRRTAFFGEIKMGVKKTIFRVPRRERRPKLVKCEFHRELFKVMAS